MTLPQTVRDKLITYEQMRELVAPVDRLKPINLIMGDNETEFVVDKDRYFAKVRDTDTETSYELSAASLISACGLVGISQGYASKFPREDLSVLVPHLNYWFNKRKKRFSILVDPVSEIVEAFNPDVHHDYMLGEVLQIANETMRAQAGEVLYDKAFCSLNSGMHFGIVLPSTMENISVGDTFAAGIHIRDSRLGKVKLRASTYLYRLVCTNGMISTHPNGHAIRCTGEDYKMDLAEWMDHTLAEAWENVSDEFKRVRNLQRTPVSDHSNRFAQQLFREFPTPKTTADALLDEIKRSETLYDVMNIMTAQANDPEYLGDPLRIEQLQMMGGRVASHGAFCEHCHSELA